MNVVLGALLALLLACGGGRDLAAGEAALARGDLPAAEAAYRRALDRDPDSPEALYGLGWTWHLAGRDDLARDAFQQCVQAAPDSPLGHKGLGSVAMAEGNAPLARQRFEEALRRAPGDVAVRHSLGLLELSAGRPDAALTAFDALAAEVPDRADVQVARALALLALQRGEDALDASARAISLGGAPRVRAQARIARARALLAVSAARVDADACTTTAPPVYAWLDEAERLLNEAEAEAGVVPELGETRRLVRRRRGAVDDACPGLRADG